MTTTKKTQSRPDDDYKIAAKARRAKIASMNAQITGEIEPSQGRIQVTLGDSAIASGRISGIHGPSLIDIPEFRTYQKNEIKVIHRDATTLQWCPPAPFKCKSVHGE